MRALLRPVVAVLALLTPFVNASPAHAATGGFVFFQGTISFAQVPCIECDASFNASLVVGVVVETDPPSYGLVTGLSAAIRYTEPGCVAGVASPTGTAHGSMTLTGTNVVGSALPVNVGFTWLRVGAAATFNPPFNNGWITFVPPPPCSGAWSPAVTGMIEFG